MLGRHDRATGKWFDRQYRDLEKSFGPFDGVMRSYTAGVASLWITSAWTPSH
jgi:hypothetical protein